MKKPPPLVSSLNNVAIVWENGAVLVEEVEKGCTIKSNTSKYDIF